SAPDKLSGHRIQATFAVRETRAIQSWRGEVVQRVKSVEAEEVGAIQYVEEVSSQLDSHSLANREAASEREIEAVKWISLTRISREISVERLKVNNATRKTIRRTTRIRSRGSEESILSGVAQSGGLPRSYARRYAGLTDIQIAAGERRYASDTQGSIRQHVGTLLSFGSQSKEF